MNAVRTSDAWAAVEFPQNYSFYLGQRMNSMFSLDNETLEGSAIRIHADMTGEFLVLINGRSGMQ